MSLLAIQVRDNIKLRNEAVLQIKNINCLLEGFGNIKRASIGDILRLIFEIMYLVVFLGAIVRIERSIYNQIKPQLLITDGREKI